MANEVALYGNATPATVVTEADGQVAKFETWDTPLVGTYSTISMVQSAKATKGSGLTAGTFIHLNENNEKSADFDVVSELWLVPIAEVRARRLCYGPYDPKNTANNLLCYSNNCIKPSSNVEEPFATECGYYDNYGRPVATCPKAVWGTDGTTPQCKIHKEIAFVELLYANPVTISLHGMALGAWNKFLSTLKRKRDMARLKRQPLSNYVIHVTSENMGQYYAYVFDIGTPPKEVCDEEKIKDYYKLAAWYGENIFAKGASNGAKTEASSAAQEEAPVTPSETKDANEEMDEVPF